MYPATGFTKAQVIDYYIRISPLLLPHLKDRPLTMKRFPDGVDGPYFYEKNAPSHAPEWIQTFTVSRKSVKEKTRYILVNELPTLAWSANMANLELHTFLARAPKVDQPTMIVFDLDPGPPANVLDCAQVALWIKEICDGFKLKSFVKISGSKGLQMYIPLNTPTDYEETKTFSKTIGETIERLNPDRALSNMSKQLRTGKVFVDWSQNSESKTTVNVYSLRAKEKPYVSVPVTWEELKRALENADAASLYMEADQVLKRVEKTGDLFGPLLTLKQKLPAGYEKKLLKVELSSPLKVRNKAASSKPSTAKGKKNDTSIETYNRKRDFQKTKEPPGDSAGAKTGGELMYVIQKHEASHLHYDFRLEMEGVLRSWAVPKGIPTKKGDKKLAMHVEDHPMSYARFEGTIPKGSYGGGTVMVWDIGTYKDETGHPVKAYYTGKFHLIMSGEKLKGEWVLVRTGKKDAAKQQWLLMKAGTEMKALTAKEDDRSALTGRTMKQIEHDNDAQWVSNRKSSGEPAQGHEEVNEALQKLRSLPRSVPKFEKPIQVKSTKKLPDGKNWIYEIDFAGERVLAIKKSGKTELLTPAKKNLNKLHPEIVESLNSLPVDSFVLDGQIFRPEKDGEEYFLAFDLLNYQDRNVTGFSLEERKRILQFLLNDPPDRILFSSSIQGDPKKIAREAKKRGFTAILAREKGSHYKPGSWQHVNI